MKNKFKIVTLILSCLLLIGGVIGISASAENSPEISIYKRIISYEGTIKIAYAVDADNLADGDEIKIAFTFNEEKGAPEGKLDASDFAYVNGVTKTYHVDGIDYPTVFSRGFAPADMTKTVYAIPLVVDANGNVVASGEKVAFSVFDYCIERFSASPTEDQFELYSSLLGYGAAVQEALLASGTYSQTELDRYGWADAYYVTKVTNKIDGVVDSVESVRYRESEVRIEAPKTYSDKMFAGFEDKDGNALTMYGADKTATSWNYYDVALPIGETEIVCNYKTAGKIQEWNGTALPSGVITSQGSASNFIHNSFDEAKTSIYVKDEQLAIYNKIWNPICIANKNATAGNENSTYVFESDIFVDYDVASSTLSSNTRLAYFDMAASGSNGYNTHFVRFTLSWSDAKEKVSRFSFRYFDGKNENHLFYIDFNKWQNLRIEYEMKTMSTAGDAEGAVKIYLDGELVATVDSAKSAVSGRNNTKFGGMHFEGNGSFGAYEILFDNTYIAAE